MKILRPRAPGWKNSEVSWAARGPHRGGTTKPRQEVFTQQEFNPEKQKGAREYRESEAQWSTPLPVRPVIGDRRCLADHKPRSSHQECIYARRDIRSQRFDTGGALQLHRRKIKQVLQGMISCSQTRHSRMPHVFRSSFRMTLKGNQGCSSKTEPAPICECWPQFSLRSSGVCSFCECKSWEHRLPPMQRVQNSPRPRLRRSAY